MRKSISKKTRFEIFKRDKFTCQYCGKQSPEVILNIDHIQPVSKGGDNSDLNLLTACIGCNSGKSNRLLSDESSLKKKINQLILLQQKREQMSLMFEWFKEISQIDDDIAKKICERFTSLCGGFSVSEHGKQAIKRLLKRFSLEIIMESIEIASSKYLEFENGNVTEDSCAWAFEKIGGICYNITKKKESI